jgi:hypothetical protein
MGFLQSKSGLCGLACDLILGTLLLALLIAACPLFWYAVQEQIVKMLTSSVQGKV